MLRVHRYHRAIVPKPLSGDLVPLPPWILVYVLPQLRHTPPLAFTDSLHLVFLRYLIKRLCLDVPMT